MELRRLSVNDHFCQVLRIQCRVVACTFVIMSMLPCRTTLGNNVDEFPIGDLADFLVEVTRIAHERWVVTYEYQTRTVTINSRDDVFFRRAEDISTTAPMLDNDTHRNESIQVSYTMRDPPQTSREDYLRRSKELFNQLDNNARRWLKYDSGDRELLSRDEWMIILKYRELHINEGPGHRVFGYRYKSLRVWVQPEGYIVEDSSDVATHLQADLKKIEALLTSKE